MFKTTQERDEALISILDGIVERVCDSPEDEPEWLKEHLSRARKILGYVPITRCCLERRTITTPAELTLLVLKPVQKERDEALARVVKLEQEVADRRSIEKGHLYLIAELKSLLRRARPHVNAPLGTLTADIDLAINRK